MSSQGVVDVHQAQLRELLALIRFSAAKFLEHDVQHQRGGLAMRARRRVEVVIGAWGEMLASDVWTDAAHEAVVCETPRRWKGRAALIPLPGFALLAPLTWLPHGFWVAMAVLWLFVLPFTPQLVRELRRSRRHRAGAPVLTFLASRRKGAGRALLDARCEAADSRKTWLCLDAPAALEGFYSGSGFVKVGEPDIGPVRTIIYMERAPRG